ncbi:hypothetical protein PM082_014615 [Marasmius tenuissimus]|nr:hypothetical protein PM082_014615 [Marasmius tenuissimus]
MVVLKQLLPSVLLAVLYASQTQAAPSPVDSENLTRDVAVLSDAFQPGTNYETFGEGLDIPASLDGNLGINNITLSFMSSKLNVDLSNIAFKSGYTAEDGVTYGYAQQSHEGIPFVNAVANVAFKNNKVVAFGSSFVQVADGEIADSTPTVELSDAVSKAEETLQGKMNEIKPTLGYFAREGGNISLVHVFQVQNVEGSTWYEAYVDAHTGELVSATSFVAHAAYKVLPVWKQDFPEGLEVVVDPQTLTSASPNGWHSGAGTTTEGNNVVSFKDDLSATTSQSSSGQVFNYTYDPTQDPTVGSNLDAARTNAFYIANSYHDSLYLYGFTEAAFNFQNDNFGRGGTGNDGVHMKVQDATHGTDNAFFATPADGEPGMCYMLLWTQTNPFRDGAMQNDLLIHELTHGLTNRMTGGGTATCLSSTESAGLGEGWSDALADWFSHTDTPIVSDFRLFRWVSGNPSGSRRFPYSTSTTTNPLRYSDLATLSEPHGKMNVQLREHPCILTVCVSPHDPPFQVWANMLHNVYAQLILNHGWSISARTNPAGTLGNVVFLNIVVKGLALQPCNPTFPQARDAIIQADVNLYDGAHRCLLWRTFASKGLGVGATGHVDSTEVPPECKCLLVLCP